jgi:hypothetical protein
VAAHYYGAEVATGFVHTFSGWVLFVVAFAILFAVMHGVQMMFPPARVAPVGAKAVAQANEVTP